MEAASTLFLCEGGVERQAAPGPAGPQSQLLDYTSHDGAAAAAVALANLGEIFKALSSLCH